MNKLHEALAFIVFAIRINKQRFALLWSRFDTKIVLHGLRGKGNLTVHTYHFRRKQPHVSSEWRLRPTLHYELRPRAEGNLAMLLLENLRPTINWIFQSIKCWPWDGPHGTKGTLMDLETNKYRNLRPARASKELKYWLSWPQDFTTLTPSVTRPFGKVAKNGKLSADNGTRPKGSVDTDFRIHVFVRPES